MKKIQGLFAFAIVALSGCAAQTPYQKFQSGKVIPNFIYQPGKSTLQALRAKTECEIVAAQRVPQNMSVRTTPSFTTPSHTQCNRIGMQTFCNTYGGDRVGGQTYSVDTNVGLRAKAYGLCMADRGYRFLNLPTCPQGTPVFFPADATPMPALAGQPCYVVTENNLIGLGPVSR